MINETELKNKVTELRKIVIRNMGKDAKLLNMCTVAHVKKEAEWMECSVEEIIQDIIYESVEYGDL